MIFGAPLPVLFIDDSFQPVGEGSVHRVYLPAGRVAPPITEVYGRVELR